jgi:hypothetical protein
LLWVAKRGQMLVGCMFVLLLAGASAGRLAAADVGVAWLERLPVGKVSVNGASAESMGPQLPSTAQVETAMQARISGLERVVKQAELDLAGQMQQAVVLREQVSEGTARLLALDQELGAVRHQLEQAQVGRKQLRTERDQLAARVMALEEALSRLDQAHTGARP